MIFVNCRRCSPGTAVLPAALEWVKEPVAGKQADCAKLNSEDKKQGNLDPHTVICTTKKIG